MIDLGDEDQIVAIKNFVRNNPDIEVYKYVQRGNNGEVYFGKRTKLDDEVVLKFYWSYPEFDASEEAVILKNINHDNILEVFDLRFLPPNFAYFLTPKISGGDLQEVIDNRKLSTKESLEIVSGILLGLTELHSAHNLVHRDLKPGNILIDLSDNHPIVADLGSVKKIETASGFVTASKSTYLYLPPEAILNNEYYYQSDIYQVGIILFQLLGGYFPVNDELEFLFLKERKKIKALRNCQERRKLTHKLIGKRIVNGKLAKLNTLPYYLDPIFKRVINKAIHFHFEKRYNNTSLFLKEIHHILRTCPEYLVDPDRLIIRHIDGRQFQIYKNSKDNLVLEKSISNDNWRKVNNHAGTMESMLSIARLK